MRNHNYTQGIRELFQFLNPNRKTKRMCSIMVIVTVLCNSLSFGQATVQTFTTSGTFNVPAGVTTMTVECWGGGGGGGGTTGNIIAAGASGGGGGGAYARSVVTVVPLSSVPFVVGTGGAGGAAGNNNGGDGTSSTWNGTTVVARFGVHGNAGNAASGAGGAGGSVALSTGQVIFAGGSGASGNTSSIGGGGGGGAGSSAAGGNASGGTAGVGGATGGGSGGAGVSASNSPVAGVILGGGGGGNRTVAALFATNRPGAAGARGQIVVSYFLPTISGFSVASGCVGASIQINGTNFTGATSVKIGGTDVTSFVVNSATQITAIVGSGTTGTVAVTAGGNTGTSAAIFTVLSSPTPFSISPLGTTNFCSIGSGVAIGTVGSDPGMTYQLMLNGTTPVGAPITGTGSPLVFPNQTTPGNYSVTVDNGSCNVFLPGVANLVADPVLSIVSEPSSATICETQSTSFSVTVPAGVNSFQWQEQLNGTGAFNNISNGGIYSISSSGFSSTLSISNPPLGLSGSKYQCVVTGLCNVVTTNGNATMIINPTPVISVTPSSQLKCSGDSISPMVVSDLHALPGTVISWTRNTPSGTGGTLTTSGSGPSPLTIAGVLTNSNNATAQVSFTISSSTGSCPGIGISSSVTLKPFLTTSATAAPASICVGSSTSLSSTPSSGTGNITILNEEFNSGSNNWTTTNSSTGGTPANAAFTLRANSYNYCSGLLCLSANLTFHGGNDNSQCYVSNSDAQGSGGTTNTFLTSPVFNLSGYASANLSFYHYYLASGTGPSVEISTNNGSTWSTLQSWTTTQGTPTNPIGGNVTMTNVSISLNSYLTQSTVQIRFHYQSAFGWVYAVDRVSVTGVPTYTYSWTSFPSGLVSSAQNPGSVTPTASTTYLLTTSSNYGSCATTGLNVQVNALPSVAAVNNSPFCSGTQNLNLIANAPTALNYSWTGPGGFSSSVANPVISNATSGTAGSYQLKVTDANGCKDSVVTTVNIYALPSVGIVVIGNSNLCTGQTSSDLQATGANSYLWNTNDNSSLITVFTAGSYAVTGTDANGCVNSYTQLITETPPPAAPEISPAGLITVCADANGPVPVILSCTNYSSGLIWSTSETTSSIAIDYSDIFNITYTDANGCYSVSGSSITELDATPPAITSPADVISCSQTPSLGLPAASDNCSVAQISNDAPSVFPFGDTDVNWTATDYSGNVSSSVQHVTILTPSSDPVSAASNANNDQLCLGGSVVLSVNGGTLGSGASWKWYEGGCGSGVSVGTGASVTISPATTGAHNYFVRAEGDCNNTACTGISISVISSPPNGTIHYTSTLSDGCVGSPATTISVNPIPGAAFYRWTSAQPGVRFNGNVSPYETTLPSVNISFVSLPSSGSSGWSVCVFAGNACGNSNTICTWIRATVSAPNTVVGSVIGCPGSSGNLYSVPLVAGAASYQWSATGGITITGNGSPSVQVSFPAGFVSGLLIVHGQTACGFNGPNRAISITAVPSIPGVLSGPSYPCPNASATYSISPVAGAASYTWTTSVPGAVVTGTSNTCSILFPSVIPAGSGISVVANSSCPSSSPVRSKGIASGIPNIPVAISGPASGQCGQTGVSYSIAPVSLATSYNWNATCGTIVGPNNLSSVTVDWPANFTTCSLTVSAANACGLSSARILSVIGSPAIPPAISGNTSPCAGSLESYSTIGSTGANNYTWTVPAGCTILGPANGTSILIMWGASSGNITARAANDCGNSPLRSLACTISCRSSQLNVVNGDFNAMVYPNPTEGKATLKITSSESQKLQLRISDLEGRVLQSEELSVDAGIAIHELELDGYSKGIYLIHLTGENLNKMLRISKE